jgi:hypothetical protein
MVCLHSIHPEDRGVFDSLLAGLRQFSADTSLVKPGCAILS